MSFRQNVRPPQNGEPVNATVAGRSIEFLRQNDQFLKDLIDNLLRPSGVYLYEQTLDSATVVGTPVYWDADATKFKPAKLALEWQPTSGTVQFAETSKVVGIVASKDSSTLGTILVGGYCELSGLDTICGEATLGDYAPSMTTAGKLELVTHVGKPVVLRRVTSTGFFFYPMSKAFEVAHTHAVFNLTCAPAGTYTPPAENDPHEISVADDSLPGWLPADHASFDGNAPAGAKFGYNLAVDESLSAWWPPASLETNVLIWNKGVEVDRLGQAIPQGEFGLVILDANGIWWMSDCYGDVPWPIDWQTGDSESDDGVCPRETHMSLQLHSTGFAIDTDPSFVSSLRSIDSRLKLYCRGTTTEATTGHLDLDLEGLILQADTADEGSLVFKEYDGTTLKRGHVVSGLWTSDPKVTLAGTETYTDDDDNEVHQGSVEISVAESATTELGPSVVKHAGTTLEAEPVVYIGMPNGPSGDEISYVVSSFEVPTTFSGTKSFRYRIRIIGREAGTLPQLTATYRIGPRPTDGLTTPISAVGAWASMTIVTVATLVASNQAVEAVSSAITVSPGDVVYVKLLRDAGAVGDSYGAELGIMQQVGLVTAS